MCPEQYPRNCHAPDNSLEYVVLKMWNLIKILVLIDISPRFVLNYCTGQFCTKNMQWPSLNNVHEVITDWLTEHQRVLKEQFNAYHYLFKLKTSFMRIDQTMDIRTGKWQHRYFGWGYLFYFSNKMKLHNPNAFPLLLTGLPFFTTAMTFYIHIILTKHPTLSDLSFPRPNWWSDVSAEPISFLGWG